MRNFIFSIVVLLLSLSYFVLAGDSQAGTTWTLTVNDLSDVQKVYTGEFYYVYARYSNSSDLLGQVLDDQSVTCAVQFNNNGTNHPMQYSAGTGVFANGFYYSMTANSNLRNYTVMCSPFSAGVTDYLNVTDYIDIYDTRLSISANKSAELGTFFTTNQNITFSANFTTLLNVTIPNAYCNISFNDSVNNTMSYVSTLSVYTYTRSFQGSGALLHNVSCFSPSLGNHTVNNTIMLVANRPYFNETFTSSNTALDDRQSAKIIFAQLNTSSNFSNLILFGGATAVSNVAKFFSYDGSTFNLETQYSSPNANMHLASAYLLDLYKTGNMFLAITGANGSARPFVTFNLTSTGLTLNNYSLVGMSQSASSLVLAPDATVSVLFTGFNESTEPRLLQIPFQNTISTLKPTKHSAFTQLYTNGTTLLQVGDLLFGGSYSSLLQTFTVTNTGLHLIQNSSGYSRSSLACGIFVENGGMDCIVSGLTNNVDTTSSVTRYLTNLQNGSFSTSDKGFANMYFGQLVANDFDNDGWLDILLVGSNSSGGQSRLYINNRDTTFTESAYFTKNVGRSGLQSGASASDFDADGDVDIALCGRPDVGASYCGVWTNNMSLWNPNYAPSQMSPPTVIYNASTGSLDINWSVGADDKTPSWGLYYNINIGTTPTGSEILSGRIGASTSDPLASFGNMQNRRNISFTLPMQTYYVKIQALDSSLRVGNWSEITVYTPDTCSLQAIGLNISQSCSYLTSDISLPQNANISLYNSSSYFIARGRIININASTNEDSGINASAGYFELQNVTVSNQDPSVMYFVDLNANATVNNTQFYNASVSLRGTINFTNNAVFGPLTIDSGASNITNVTVDSLNVLTNTVVSNVTFTSVSVSPAALLTEQQFIHVVTNTGNTRLELNQTSVISNQTSVANFTILLPLATRTNTSIAYVEMYTLRLSKSGFTPYMQLINISNQTSYTINLQSQNEPDWSEFANTESTNLTELAVAGTLDNVSNLTLAIPSYGLVRFNASVNISGLNLSNLVTIQNGTIIVNSSRLNVSATLVFAGLSYQFTPILLHNGVVCNSCTTPTYAGGNYTVNVSSFSSYSLVANSNLSVTSSTSYFKYAVGRPVRLDFAYIQTTTSTPITGATCVVRVDDGTLYSAVFNTSILKYNTYITFAQSGINNFTANCSAPTYENKTLSSSLNIRPDRAELIDSNLSLPGLFYSTAIEHDGLIYLWGKNQTANSMQGHLVNFSSSELTISQLNTTLSMTQGYAAAGDFRNSGVLDIVLKGNAINSNLVLLKNAPGSSQSENILNTPSALDGSILTQDFNEDGYLDIFATSGSLANTSYSLLSNSSGFTVSNVSGGLTNAELISVDFDADSDLDVVLFGQNDSATTQTAHTYFFTNNAGTFTYNSSFSFPPLSRVSVTRINSSQFLAIGLENQTKIGTSLVYNATAYLVNGTTLERFSLAQPKYFFGTIALGDILNTGLEQLFASGLDEADSSFVLSKSGIFDPENNFAQNQTYSIEAIAYGTSLWFDYQNDGDLDLFISGQNSSGAPVTKLYISDQSYYVNNTPPITPIINQTPLFANNSFTNSLSITHVIGLTQNVTISWNKTIDDHTAQNNLTYSIRVGDATNRHKYQSGIAYSSSNPTVQFRGNMGSRTNWTVRSVPANQCLIYAVQAFDSARAASAWNETTISYTEICDGLDNDCDGLVDETWDANNDGFVQNVTACQAYLLLYSNKVDNCDTATDTSSIDNIKTCPTSSIISTNTNARTNGGGGGVAPVSTSDLAKLQETVAPTKPVQQTSEQVETQPEPTAPPAQTPASTSQKTAREIETDYRDGRTYVTEMVRNKQRTTIEQMTVRKVFPKDVLESASLLTSVTPFTIIEEDPVIDFHLGKMGYLETKPLVYSIPGRVDASQISQLVTQIFTEQELSEEQIAQKEAKEEAKAAVALNVSVAEIVVGNQTQLTIDLNLTENITSVQNVEIEQFIPKCLLSEITQTVLEAGVDKELLNSVRIKEADPIIVWNLQEVTDATKLTLNINSLRPEDCDDEIKIKTLAREYIKANYEINPANLSKSLLLTVGIFVLFFALYLISNYLKSEHEDAQVHDVVKRILKRYHTGTPLDIIKKELYADRLSATLIESAFAHIRNEQLEKRHKFWHAAIENGITIFIFTTALVLNSMEFFGFLPGYLDWIKKVLSWVLIILLLYDANLTKIVFNNSKRWINITLLFGMFCMYLKSLVIYAKTKSLDENTYFIFDLYAYVLNHHQFFTTTLFFIGTGLVLVASIAMAWTLQVKEGCLYFTFSHHPIAHTLWQKIKRSLKLFAIFMFFGFSIFNRVVEWLGVAIDTTIFMIVILMLLFILASTSFMHAHKAFKRHSIEIIVRTISKNSLWLLFGGIFVFTFVKPFLSSIVVQGIMGMFSALILVIVIYTLRSGIKDHFATLEKMSAVVDEATTKFVKLFSHPSTIFLGISGLFLLQHIVEIALYIIPNITGQADSDYSSYAVSTLLGLFSDTSIIAAHLFTLDIFSRFVVGSIYAISILGGLFLFLVPLVVWTLYFMQRHTHPSQISIRDMFFDKTNTFFRLCQFILIFAVPSILVSIATNVLTISYASNVTDTSYVGIIISAQKLAMSAESAFLLLLGYLLYILIAWFLQHACITKPKITGQTSRALVSITIVISFTSLFALYVIPYVLSIITYIESLLTSAASAQTLSLTLYWILIVQFWADILLVYICGSAILIFFGLPRTIKMQVIRGLSHIPFFHHLFFLASSLSHIDYYSESAQRHTGNILAHVKHYLQTLEADGHHLETIIYQLKVHGYPQDIIDEAVSQLVSSKKFVHTLEHTKAEHISVHQVKKLIPLIKKEFAKQTTHQEMYELFMDRFTHAEIKLALLYVDGDLKGDVSITRVREIEDAQIQSLLSLIKQEFSQHKTREQIVRELATKGYDAELILRVLEHPLFNKDEAAHVVTQLTKELEHIVRMQQPTEALIRFVLAKYPYPLVVRAFAQKQLATNKLIHMLRQAIAWVIAALKKKYTSQQIQQQLVARKWSPALVQALIVYATFVIESEHHVDKIIEKDYIELGE